VRQHRNAGAVGPDFDLCWSRCAGGWCCQRERCDGCGEYALHCAASLLVLSSTGNQRETRRRWVGSPVIGTARPLSIQVLSTVTPIASRKAWMAAWALS